MKKKKGFYLLVLLFTSICGYPQTPQASSAETEVKNMEIVWMTALAKKDSAVLRQTLGDDFELAKVGGDPATNINREQWLKNALEMDWGRFRFESTQIKVDSNLASVNAVLSFRLKPYPFRLSSGVLDVWRKTDGKWKIEKRYLGQDNLSRWLQIITGVGIGMGILLLIRWVRIFFAHGKSPLDK